MATCGTGCDSPNKEDVMCPTRMADGRAFTDYRPRCAVNGELLTQVAGNKMIGSSYESRMFLQHNADQMMDYERNKAIQRLIPCAPCNRSFQDEGTMLSERYVVRCNGVTCTREEVNPFGVGDGRNYK
jgi:hypothetical protein